MSSSGFTTNATLPSGGSGALSVSSIQPADTSTQSANLLTSIGQFSNQVIEVDFTIAEVYANGTTSTPVTTPRTETVSNDVNLQIWPTGSSHLVVRHDVRRQRDRVPARRPRRLGQDPRRLHLRLGDRPERHRDQERDDPDRYGPR